MNDDNFWSSAAFGKAPSDGSRSPLSEPAATPSPATPNSALFKDSPKDSPKPRPLGDWIAPAPQDVIGWPDLDEEPVTASPRKTSAASRFGGGFATAQESPKVGKARFFGQTTLQPQSPRPRPPREPKPATPQRHNYQGLKRQIDSPDSSPIAARPKYELHRGALEAQASLLARKDFTALEVLHAVYRDSVGPPPPPEQPVFQEEDEWGAFPAADSSGDYQRERIVLDDNYLECYDRLCDGFAKLIDLGLPLDVDCETNQSTSSVCRALKSKYYHQYSPGPEMYSRKARRERRKGRQKRNFHVFVGGLPIDIEEGELVSTFSRFGPLTVDWPNKKEHKSYTPPKGYVFLIFDSSSSVRDLVDACFAEDEKLFLHISSPLHKEKLVQVRPWRLADADYLVDVNVPVDPRRVVFVGGVPRPIRAVELAHIMDRLYGSVACAGIDTDVEYKYPKGAGRVAFTNHNSYMRAITDRFAQLSHGEVDKRVEMKPYVLDDQPCDECDGERCGGRHAPFFCPHLDCLQYYCESCWTLMHSCPSRENHKPLVKEA